PVSISVILFNSRFRSYGAQGVLKKHPFCGAFLVFWGFKFLSIKAGNESFTRSIPPQKPIRRFFMPPC
ncbi:hypothetical protein RRI15_21695, partial [Escherichia coli]|nr:hypothetical protein [Escherichia coli]MDT8541194.1 hypothetical protein [Escherichia coli]MDT8579233.1 hypothetical protein [Escherichia coli]